MSDEVPAAPAQVASPTAASPEAASPAPQPKSWEPLSMVERRILGVLVEKAKTTPDAYPLSLNALLTGANQKSNRDPVLNLSQESLEEALPGLQKKGVVMKLTGGRVIRWRHYLYEAWNVDKVEISVLAELLLRGPQTEGELRTRASRMEPIDDLDGLRNVLKPLVERGLVVYLTPPGKRGTILTHGFHAPQDLEKLKAKHAAEAEQPEEGEPAPRASSPEDAARVAAVEAGLAEVRTEITALRSMVTDMQAVIAQLKEQVSKLQKDLGV